MIVDGELEIDALNEIVAGWLGDDNGEMVKSAVTPPTKTDVEPDQLRLSYPSQWPHS